MLRLRHQQRREETRMKFASAIAAVALVLATSAFAFPEPPRPPRPPTPYIPAPPGPPILVVPAPPGPPVPVVRHHRRYYNHGYVAPPPRRYDPPRHRGDGRRYDRNRDPRRYDRY
jgi:hypothetical protein